MVVPGGAVVVCTMSAGDALNRRETRGGDHAIGDKTLGCGEKPARFRISGWDLPSGGGLLSANEAGGMATMRCVGEFPASFCCVRSPAGPASGINFFAHLGASAMGCGAPA